MSTRVRPELIDGEWRRTETVAHDINPSELSDIVCDYAVASDAEVADAIAAANAAFPAWSLSSILQRSDILGRIGDEIHARKE